VPVVKRKCDILYDKCYAKKGIGGSFSQDELKSMDVADDDANLAALCQELMDCQLFIAYGGSRGVPVEYRLRSKEDALK
jgi:hypothetical protein